MRIFIMGRDEAVKVCAIILFVVSLFALVAYGTVNELTLDSGDKVTDVLYKTRSTGVGAIDERLIATDAYTLNYITITVAATEDFTTLSVTLEDADDDIYDDPLVNGTLAWASITEALRIDFDPPISMRYGDAICVVDSDVASTWGLTIGGYKLRGDEH